MVELPRLYRVLIESVRLVASDCRIQIDCLPKFVNVPDEIALTYHDAFLLTDQLTEAGLLGGDQAHRLEDLDKHFDQMNANTGLWTLAALRQDVKWEDARKKAQDILSMLNVDYAPPDLFWLTFIGTS